MKKTLLSILMVLSLLLLPACGTQVGQKSASSNVVYKESSVKQEILCVQKDLAVFLIDYKDGKINKEEFLSFAEVVCPALMERKVSERDFLKELSGKGDSQ